MHHVSETSFLLSHGDDGARPSSEGVAEGEKHAEAVPDDEADDFIGGHVCGGVVLIVFGP